MKRRRRRTRAGPPDDADRRRGVFLAFAIGFLAGSAWMAFCLVTQR